MKLFCREKDHATICGVVHINDRVYLSEFKHQQILEKRESEMARRDKKTYKSKLTTLVLHLMDNNMYSIMVGDIKIIPNKNPKSCIS